MALVYRTMFQDDRSDLAAAVEVRWQDWLRSKSYSGPFPEDQAEVVEGPWRLRRSHDSHEGCSAIRLELAEDQGAMHWTTTATVICAADEQWVWLDLEMVRDEVHARPPDIRAPRLVRDLLAEGTARMGTARLRAHPFTATKTGDAQLLVQTMCDEDRGAPLVVFSPRRGESTDELVRRAERTAAGLAGIANTWLLEDESVCEDFNDMVGESMRVHGGAVRTYLPSIDPEDPRPWRHRFLRWEIARQHTDAATGIIGRSLLANAAAMRPPLIYRTHQRHLPGLRFGRSPDVDDYVMLLEEEVERLQADLKETTEARDLLLLEVDEATRDLGRAQSRQRRLEQQVAAAGGDPWSEVPAGEPVPDVADGCLHAVQLARQHLDGVVVPEHVNATAEALDAHQDASTWGAKAWNAFRALQDYVDAKRVGAAGDFTTLLESGRIAHAIPKTWWSPHESETTGTNPRFRDARTLPVDTQVDPSGRIYMPAHIKLVPGGRPAPRIHLCDDVSGVTGKVHVGHFGDHLENSKTN